MSENVRRLIKSAPLAPGKAAMTRASIVDAGREFVQTRPFRDLTVGKLMAMTPHSRPTFYMYFNDVHGLMEALLDEVKLSIIAGAEPWLSGVGDPVESLTTSLTALVEVGYDHGPILRAVSDAAPNDDRLEYVWTSFLGAFDEVVSARIAQDQERGRTPPFDPMPVARALNRMDAGMLIHAFGGPETSSKEDVLSAFLRVWISTLYPADAQPIREKREG